MSAARKTDSSGSSVSSDSSTPGDGIHKCDTVPPPEGEADAYNAPTRIGPMAHGLIEQLMAQAEAMTGTGRETAPPKSGERPLAARKPLPSGPPIVMAPPPAAIPRVYDAQDDGDDGDQLDPTSMFNQSHQSGATKLLEIAPTAPNAPVAASVTSSAPPAAATSSPPPVGTPSIAAQLDAYRASTRAARDGSDAKLLIVTCVIVTLGLAALYFIFLAA